MNEAKLVNMNKRIWIISFVLFNQNTEIFKLTFVRSFFGHPVLQRGSANQGSQEMKGPEILSWFGFPADESVYISLKFFSSHHCFMFYILLNRLHNLLELSDAFAITCVNARQLS